jgi:hypothetical protein
MKRIPKKSHAFGNSCGKHAFHALLGKEKKRLESERTGNIAPRSEKIHWLNEKMHLDYSK